MRSARALFVLVCTLACTVLAGCGSSSTPAYKRYKDPMYGFSLQYPYGWKAPKTQQGTADNAQSYIVSFDGGDVGMRVVVNNSMPNFSSITNGQVSHQGNQTLTFYRLTISGRPAVLIYEKTNGVPLDHESAHLNTRLYGYDIQMVAVRAITKPLQNQFDHLLHSFTLGKKG